MVISHTSARALVLVGVVLALGIGGCCFGGGTAATPGVTPPSVPGLPGTPPTAPPPAAGGQAVNLAPGFAPDPTTVSVVAGGPVDGSTMGAADGWCAGSYPAAAQITLTTATAIPGLRIVARSDQDTTMAIRLADGRVFCNDDGAGYPNPQIDGSVVAGGIPAGTHQVYVGSFGSGGQGANATVGFTVNAALQPAQLP
ncbi:MAG: hypothetical protein OHK0013_22840 [Sandaracinaceae bacterium]